LIGVGEGGGLFDFLGADGFAVEADVAVDRACEADWILGDNGDGLAQVG